MHWRLDVSGITGARIHPDVLVGARLRTATLLLVFGLGGLSGCAPSLPERSGAVDVRSVDDVIAQPDRYLGRTITVRGEAAEAPGRRAFLVRDHDPSSHVLLVLVPHQVAWPDAWPEDLEGRPLKVTGRVRRLVVPEIERETRLDLDPRTEAEFHGRLILIAIDIVPELASDPAQ